MTTAAEKITPPWLAAAVLTLLLLALQAGGHDLHLQLQLQLRYERATIGNGTELWRALSGHLVHLGWAHTWLNVAGIWLCFALAPQLFRPATLVTRLLFLCTAVSALLFWFSPQVGNYAGFSGVLYGLFLLGLAPQVFQAGIKAPNAQNWPATLSLLLVCGWALWQWLGGTSADEEKLIGGNIIAIAHIWGLLAASLWLLVSWQQTSRLTQ